MRISSLFFGDFGQTYRVDAATFPFFKLISYITYRDPYELARILQVELASLQGQFS